MIHGGGFCLGGPEGEEQTCRNFVLAFGATCVSIAYRLGPEYSYPYAPHDCWDGLKWCASNASLWNADLSAGFVVGGTSAGGNLAAVLTHRARDEHLSPPLTGQYLAIPQLCAEGKVPERYRQFMLSYEQNKNPLGGLPKAAIDMFMSGYKPDNEDGVNFSIFNHPNGHKSLPPTFFQIDGADPLRDEAIIFERVLRKEDGVETRMNLYPGLPHGHWGFYPFLESSTQFRKDQIDGMSWLLGRKPELSKVMTEAAATTL